MRDGAAEWPLEIDDVPIRRGDARGDHCRKRRFVLVRLHDVDVLNAKQVHRVGCVFFQALLLALALQLLFLFFFHRLRSSVFELVLDEFVHCITAVRRKGLRADGVGALRRDEQIHLSQVVRHPIHVRMLLAQFCVVDPRLKDLSILGNLLNLGSQLLLLRVIQKLVSLRLERHQRFGNLCLDDADVLQLVIKAGDLLLDVHQLSLLHLLIVDQHKQRLVYFVVQLLLQVSPVEELLEIRVNLLILVEPLQNLLLADLRDLVLKHVPHSVELRGDVADVLLDFRLESV